LQSPQDKPQKPISRAEAISRLWKIPNLTYKLHATQKDMYDKVQASEEKIMVVACSRGWGKSYALLTIAIETCLRKPNAIVKYLAPTAKDLKNIVLPNFRQITEDCPKEIRDQIKYKPNEGKIVFEMNGSEIHLAGTEKGNAEKVRGVSADLCIVDEAGFCDDLDYVIKSILFPTITRGTGTRGKKIIMASTPSKTNDHDFIKYMRDHEFKGKLISYDVYSNPRLKLEAEENGYSDVKSYVENVIAAQYSEGINATAFLREYMVQVVTEESNAVIPEFKKELQDKIIKVWEDPVQYSGYVSMDIGFKDLTFVIFAYYDFKNAKLVLKDELVLSGTKMLTDNLALEIKMKESSVFINKYTGASITPHLRVSDNNNPILLQDLAVKHGVSFMATAKDNFEAALNNMRMMLKSERIVIDPKCKQLIAHLKGAIWNSARTSFARSPDKGHYDGVSSLIYLCRNVNFNLNPYPTDSYNPNNFYMEGSNKPANEFEKMIQNTFTPKFRRRR
jgi:Terminase large subunit, T4likevirus-type, N-terminal